MVNSGKVCLIAPSLKLGGLENAVTVIANYFAGKGIQVKIVTAYNFPVFYSLHPAIEVVSPSKKKEKTQKYIYYLWLLFYFRKTIKAIKPDTIVSYGDYINALVLFSLMGLKTPVFISDRSSPGKKFPFLVSAMRKMLYRRAKGIIAQTEIAKQQKERMLGKNANIKIIPNPIRQVSQFGGEKKSNTILAVGRHYHVKGLDRLIKAFSLVQSQDWTLEIAGTEGPATSELQSLVRKLGLEKKVVFLGGVKEIDQLYARSSVFVLPSRSEGFPNALIEAMAHGLPCISFDINAGPSDIITNNQNGLLVEDGNLEELANQIQRLIDNPGLRAQISSEAQKIRQKLDLEIIGKEYLEFILSS